ncbi:B-cell receptor CD22 isoform X2 [Pleuronectes platessa]|uniref:B-cell receptor CD22 isoform X2 n=1 Tax=Pleuronectes platessa TaxID=8262 RepID=UPI00232A535D|nr:B-cell receptor CD22 isoform X2 [Pleuronectes platessa]
MSVTAAASGIVVLLLTVTVVRSQKGWDVSYTSTEICAVRGSTVDINCTYKYPSTVNNHDTSVQETFWFIKESNGIHVDLRTDPEYAGRVEYLCGNNTCTLRISSLRESDSAVYKFRFTTNQPNGSFTGLAGVTLSVTGLHVQVSTFTRGKSYNYAALRCQSTCRLPEHPNYVWYKYRHREKFEGASFSGSFYSADRVSCAVKGQEDFRSLSMLVRSQNGWDVSYTSTEICDFRGSTVDINCTYTYPSRLNYLVTKVQETFWFIKESNGVHVDLRTDPEYSGRVEYLCGNNTCTLRISNLRESDSAVYKFWFTTNQPTGSLTGSAEVTLSVAAPQLQVHVRRSTANPYSTWTELSCHSRYAPKVPSVSVSPSREIMEGSSVTLTCSSDANPAAKYTWYKRSGDKQVQPSSEETQFVLSSIRTSDSGEYYCTAENELGRSSANTSITVTYAPKPPSVSVSPSGEIMEGSSVNLTCSSDANPAANYTWYKENRTLLQGPEGVYRLSSISSWDSGVYSCKSENQYGQINSTSLYLDVQYAPKPPSVSVSPSGEIMEGSSVTLTCSSDANPAANYTWYKEDEASTKASGQIFIISNITAEHGGKYQCEAQNTQGRSNTTLHLTVGAGKSVIIMNTIRVTLVVVLVPVLVWTLKKRMKKTLSLKSEVNEAVEMIESHNCPEYDDVAAAAQTEDTEDQEDLV